MKAVYGTHQDGADSQIRFFNRLLFGFAFMSPFFDEKVPRVGAEWGVLALTNETCTIVFGGLSTKLK